MNQLKKNKDQKSTDLTNARKKFEELKSKEVEKADTRIVNVKVRVGCGCGGSFKWYHGKVPTDSSIKDGHYFNDVSDFGLHASNIKGGKYYG